MANAVKYTRTIFEPEHELFRESFRAFLDKHVKPYHDQWEKDKIVDRGVWLEAGKQGFLGMAVPRSTAAAATRTSATTPSSSRRPSPAATAVWASRCTTTSWRPICWIRPTTSRRHAGCRSSAPAR